MVPPRVPQFRWVDLGLPSGTLWLDRPVGAKSVKASGLYYQWGAVIGHSRDSGYDFTEANYEAQGLDLITSSLDDANDAARAFYGPSARMPSSAQVSELLANCSITKVGRVFQFTSNLNGERLLIKGDGYYEGATIHSIADLYVWSRSIGNNTLHITGPIEAVTRSRPRWRGQNIIAVHS